MYNFSLSNFHLIRISFSIINIIFSNWINYMYLMPKTTHPHLSPDFEIEEGYGKCVYYLLPISQIIWLVLLIKHKNQDVSYIACKYASVTLSLAVLIHVVHIQSLMRSDSMYCTYSDLKLQEISSMENDKTCWERLFVYAEYIMTVHPKQTLAFINFGLAWILSFFVIFSFFVLLLMNLLSVACLVFCAIPILILTLMWRSIISLLKSGIMFMKKMIRVAEMQKMYKGEN